MEIGSRSGEEYSISRKSKKVAVVETAFRTIKTDIPAPGTEEVLSRLDARESLAMHDELPIVWDKAENFSVYDGSGNKWIDFTSGIFAASVGHSNARVTQYLQVVLERHLIHPYAYATELRARYLETLCGWSGFDKAFLLSQGTEATECALKIMRLNGQKRGKRRSGVLCIDGSFHGRTMGAQLMCGNPKNQGWIGFADPNITHFPFPSEDVLTIRKQSGAQFFREWLSVLLQAKQLEADKDFCGVMLETFQGWAAWFYPTDFVQEIEKWCRENGLLLCFDEMQSGFARTGRKFGYEHYGVKPDLICVGKGMGGGFPVSAVLCTNEVADVKNMGDMSNTHSGSPMACAAGLAVIEEIEVRSLVSETERKGTALMLGLQSIKEQFPLRVTYARGKGLIAALIFNSAEFPTRVAELCFQRGLLVVHTGRESIKIGPPLTITDDALVEALEVLAQAIADIEKEFPC